MKTVGDAGELELIRRITHRLPGRADVVLGTGDDCAIVRIPGAKDDLVYTTDAVIEGVHALPTAKAEQVGHKAVGRALSDIASMGATPLHILINLVAPASCPLARIEGIYRGASRLAATFGAAIVGGDTAKGPRLELHVFGVGSLPRGTALLRSGAKPGDAMFVTGRLGGSIKGRHLTFTPRVAEGRWLREGRWATSMIDLSDGLATDLRHVLAASRVAAVIDPDAVPRTRGCTFAQAMSDGEDFELLFTAGPARADALERAWTRSFKTPLSRIGTIARGEPSIILPAPDGSFVEWTDRAFEHFR